MHAMRGRKMFLAHLELGHAPVPTPVDLDAFVAQQLSEPVGMDVDGSSHTVYVANSGGGLPWGRNADGSLWVGWLTGSDYSGGRIERVDLSTGKAERLFDSWIAHGATAV